MIFQLGQSQDGRMPRELRVHFSDLDERTTEELMLFTKKFSEFVHYYPDIDSAPARNWSKFFPYDEAGIKPLLENKSADLSPHLALFLSFLELYKKPQEVINRITGRHLDFYYKDVLRLKKKLAVADKTHVLLELKKNALPISILPQHLFSAGKDNTGVELIYAPTRETVINRSKVDSLRSIYLDNNNRGAVRYAPVANSPDGLGGELNGEEAKWHGFGHQGLPQAEVGFAIASPVLRMKEGTRTITVTLKLNNIGSAKLNNAALSNAFEVFITGEKHWMGPYSLSPTLSNENLLSLNFIVPESEKGVIDYDAAIHGYFYVAHAPILQVFLKSNGPIGYNDFKGVTLLKASLSVEVSNISSLSLENDGGVLDPKKAFFAFGPQPTIGSRFMIGYTEALSKKLSEIKIKVQWKDAPADFSTHYAAYGVSAVNNSWFTTAVSFRDGGSWQNTSHGVRLFESGNASSEHTFIFSPGTSSVSPGISAGIKMYELHASGSLWAINAANKYVLHRPVFKPFKRTVPDPREGFITFSLEKDFLHTAYRKKYVENVMKYSKGELLEGQKSPVLVIPNEPYTPAMQTMSLSYKAHSGDISIESGSLDDYSNEDVHFFHIAYFGQMREHTYQRKQFDFLANKNVSLMPEYNNEGELIIGFKDLRAGDSVSVLFQVAEGSADPDLEQEEVRWFVLCDNYWKPLKNREVVLDTTNQLLTSGIIQFIVPAEATATNTILPAGQIWIKASVAKNVNAVCQMIEVAANAMEVQFIDNGNDPGHLITALEKGKITKLKSGVSVVKALKQPHASFGGHPTETDDAFYTRVSEGLRHKNRCITVWDYERIILSAFPNVRQVKCVPHAKEGNWLAPGNVLIVVIPDLKNRNSADLLQPKVDADTISRITSYMEEHTGIQVKVKVKNPSYQKIQCDLKVKFRTGYEFNYYSEAIKQGLIRFLSPWAYDTSRPLSFGGMVYKSVLLDFVEDLEYVDYITDFKLYSYIGEAPNAIDINEARPETPDAILVSAETHIINKTET